MSGAGTQAPTPSSSHDDRQRQRADEPVALAEIRERAGRDRADQPETTSRSREARARHARPDEPSPQPCASLRAEERRDVAELRAAVRECEPSEIVEVVRAAKAMPSHRSRSDRSARSGSRAFLDPTRCSHRRAVRYRFRGEDVPGEMHVMVPVDVGRLATMAGAKLVQLGSMDVSSARRKAREGLYEPMW